MKTQNEPLPSGSFWVIMCGRRWILAYGESVGLRHRANCGPKPNSHTAKKTGAKPVFFAGGEVVT